jgi:hypothetical protein
MLWRYFWYLFKKTGNSNYSASTCNIDILHLLADLVVPGNGCSITHKEFNGVKALGELLVQIYMLILSYL